MEPQSQFKRNIAYKVRIRTILTGKPLLEAERLKSVDIGDKQLMRINCIGNVVEKYIQEGEKKFGSLTIDDGSGQIKIKAFGDDVDKLQTFNQGDTLLVIGLLRYWNQEVYITAEILKKQDISYLLLRKLEIEAEAPKSLQREQIAVLKDKIIMMVKEAEKEGGIDIDKIITTLHEPPESINQEIKRLLEEGIAYEPRPGKLRWLG
mgnify:CR=1 FL=1